MRYPLAGDVRPLQRQSAAEDDWSPKPAIGASNARIKLLIVRVNHEIRYVEANMERMAKSLHLNRFLGFGMHDEWIINIVNIS